MWVMCRALFLPLMLSLVLHFALFAEPLWLMRIVSPRVQSPDAVEPMLQVSLVAPARQQPLLQFARGEESGDSVDDEDTGSGEALAAASPAPPELAGPPSLASPGLERQDQEGVLNAAIGRTGAGAESPPRPVVREPAENRGSNSNERRLPQQGELTYSLYWSKDRWLVGKAIHRWSVDSGGHYTLSSESKTTGLFALLHPLTISDETHGYLTDQGMAPFHYVTRANDEPAATVHFDRQTSRIRFYLNNVPRLTAAVDGKVFDKLSFLYQLYLMRPQERTFTIMITLGYRIEPYVIETVGEEQIETGLGSMNAVHLKRINLGPGDDHVEVWLAPAMDFLPVKLLFFNDRGQYYEQSINSVRSAAG